MEQNAELTRWAQVRTLNLAARLTSHGAEIAQLRAADVSFHRIRALYPLSAQDWINGILDLTFDAEMLGSSQVEQTQLDAVEIVNHSWANEARVLAGALAKEYRSKELAEAWSRATDDENPSLTPDALTFIVLLMDALANDRARPSEGALDAQSWNAAMPGYREAVDDLADLLIAGGWRCHALRAPRVAS